MPIFNRTRQTLVARDVSVAQTIFSRLKGLLGRASLDPSEALVITRCQSIHMYFMKFPIDVIFVGRDHRVVGLVRNIHPFKVSPHFSRADYVIECFPGTIDASQTAVGDLMEQA